MEDSEIDDIISKLKGRRKYEEKKAKKLGYSSIFEYFKDKINKEKNKQTPPSKPTVQKKPDSGSSSCGCC